MWRRRSAFGALVAVVGSILVSLAPVAGAQSGPVADYRFQETLASSAGSAHALEPLIDPDDPQSITFATENVNGSSRTVARFPFDHGFELQRAGDVMDPATYTLAVLFRFDELRSGFQSIANLKGGNEDNAYYSLGGHLVLYSGENDDEPTLTPTYHQVIFTRDANGGVVFYVDGVRVHEYQDVNGYGMLDTVDNSVWFFRDGGGPLDEAGSGAVARIRIWNSVLSDSEVAALDDHGPGPGQGGGGGGGGDGDPVENCDPNDPNSTCGTNGDDNLEDNDGVIEAGPGRDEITAVIDSGTTSLVVNSGPDADTVHLRIDDPSSTASIVINGDSGDDTIFIPPSPGSASPVLNAGRGNDVIRLDPGAVSRNGLSARAALQGDAGGYQITAGAGNDAVTAGGTADAVNAGGGADVVKGAGGADDLTGAGGPDSVDGGAGGDDLAGGAGKDVLHGGGGANDFAGGAGKDTCLSDTKKDKFTGCERVRRNHRRNH